MARAVTAGRGVGQRTPRVRVATGHPQRIWSVPGSKAGRPAAPVAAFGFALAFAFAFALPMHVAAGEPLRQAYARYLGEGRGDVEIHLTGTGRITHASTRPLGDGMHRCDVSGLNDADDPPAADDAGPTLARRLIHETTHCQTSPYAAGLRSGGEGPAAAAADLLVALTLENVADARVVVEVFRVDGADAVSRAAAALMRERAAPASLAHTTAAAIADARALTLAHPRELDTGEQAFEAALRTGQSSAWATLRGMLRQQGREALADAPEVLARRTALAAALQRAAAVFAGTGRHDNRAASVRETPGETSPSDHHFYVAQDGSVRTVPVVSAEGAHHAAVLAARLRARVAPEERIAVQWLRCQGALETRSLDRLSGSLMRLMRNFTDGSAAQTLRATRVLGAALGGCRPGQSADDMLDHAADRLKTAFAPG